MLFRSRPHRCPHRVPVRRRSRPRTSRTFMFCELISAPCPRRPRRRPRRVPVRRRSRPRTSRPFMFCEFISAPCPHKSAASAAAEAAAVRAPRKHLCFPRSSVRPAPAPPPAPASLPCPTLLTNAVACPTGAVARMRYPSSTRSAHIGHGLDPANSCPRCRWVPSLSERRSNSQ